MEYIEVTGGNPLRGSIRPAAAKNSVLPLLAAALLCSGPVRLQNVPRLTDVEDCLALLRGVGCTAGWQGAALVVQGQPMRTDLAPVRVNVSTDDLYDPVMMLSEQIGTAAHQVLEKTPPELAGDIYRNGVMLTGGGAQLHGLTEYLSQELKVEVTVSPDPVNCVALGTAQSLSLGDKLETGFTDATPRIGRR